MLARGVPWSDFPHFCAPAACWAFVSCPGPRLYGIITYDPGCITGIGVDASSSLCEREKILRLFGAKQQKMFCPFLLFAIGHIVDAVMKM